jgi:predicted GIY-YIG superfamily endonuclease
MLASPTISRGGCQNTRASSFLVLHANTKSIASVHFEAFDSVLEARAREYSLKRWRRAWKIALIEKFNTDWRDLTDELGP